MAITKAEILSHLNSELNRSETDIDEHILQAMKDISLSDDFVWIESEVSMVVGTKYYSLPSDYKKLMNIHLKDGDNKELLAKVTFEEYMNAVADVEDSDDYGEPFCFAIHGGYWYPWYVPDDTYTAVLHYCSWIPESEVIDEATVNAVDNIDRYYSDIFRNAIYTLTKAHYCMAKEMEQKANNYLLMYRNIQLPMLKKLVQRQPKSLPYTDLF